MCKNTLNYWLVGKAGMLACNRDVCRRDSGVDQQDCDGWTDEAKGQTEAEEIIRATV